MCLPRLVTFCGLRFVLMNFPHPPVVGCGGRVWVGIEVLCCCMSSWRSRGLNFLVAIMTVPRSMDSRL